MLRILALGVPVQIRARLEKEANRHGDNIASILCEIDKYGFYQLLPKPNTAIHHLRVYYEDDAFQTSYEDALVIVFPYAEVPTEIDAELLVIEELGGRVIYTKAGVNGWPEVPSRRKKGRDDNFFDAVFKAANNEIFGAPEIPASQLFLRITEICSRIIVTQGALHACDQVAKHRIPFIENSALAFVEFIENNGAAGRIDAFFRERGIEHAQTGGIETTLKVYRGGKCIYNSTAHTHLKKGDKTKPQAAVRIYYHIFYVDKEQYIAVLYVGPHPEYNISCEHFMED